MVVNQKRYYYIGCSSCSVMQIYSGITFMPQTHFRVLMLYMVIICIKSVIKSMQGYENLRKFLCPDGICFSSVLGSRLGRFC